MEGQEWGREEGEGEGEREEGRNRGEGGSEGERRNKQRKADLLLLCLASYPTTTPLSLHSSNPNSFSRQLARPYTNTDKTDLQVQVYVKSNGFSLASSTIIHNLYTFRFRNTCLLIQVYTHNLHINVHFPLY